jgi:capsular exopolysaccharide synthesis family protein
MAMSTVDFIDSQISDVSDSLSRAESVLKSFKSSNSIMDLSFQGQEAFTKLNTLETEKANLQSQRRYYVYLRDYLANNENVSDLAAPSSMNVADPLLTTLITKMLELNAQRVSLIRDQINTQNLYLTDINLQIDNLKKTLKENVNNSLNTLVIAINEVDYRISRLSGQISQMPKTELQLKTIERKFKLNDEVYTFLLQKRSEAQIAKAASMPDYEVVDAARLAVSGLVSPRGTLNYAIAFFLALLMPTVIVLGRDFLNNKLSEAEEIEYLTRYPIMGKIFHNAHRSKQIVNDYPNSSVTESFRALRTNFQFFSEGGKRQVLLLTSSTSGEGKTFCSLNLATVFALNGHRTVLLEFDLRRPKIHQEFGSSNIIGITSYLIDKANIEDIIVPTHIENLDLISAGPAAPNPAELINSERTAELIEKLKEIYDFIIIDSAPAGILTETLLLMKYADLNIFVARMEKTVRDVFRNALRTVENNKFENVSILINDLNVKRDAHKYGYDNKYYTDDRKKGMFSWLKRK